jgi:hypothetical protein
MEWLTYDIVSQFGKPHVKVELPDIGTKTLRPE